MEDIRVNVKTLAAKLRKSVEGLTHSQALEAISESAGYKNYRALKALATPEGESQLNLHQDRADAIRHVAQIIELYDDATMKNDYMLDSSECAEILEALAQREEFLARSPKPGSTHKRENGSSAVIAEIRMKDWELSGMSKEKAKAEYKGNANYLLQEYQTKVRLENVKTLNSAPSLCLDTLAVGGAKTGGLSLVLEINDGVPCIHVSNHPEADPLLSIFGTPEGLVVRENESPLIAKKSVEVDYESVSSRILSTKAEEPSAWLVKADTEVSSASETVQVLNKAEDSVDAIKADRFASQCDLMQVLDYDQAYADFMDNANTEISNQVWVLGLEEIEWKPLIGDYIIVLDSPNGGYYCEGFGWTVGRESASGFDSLESALYALRNSIEFLSSSPKKQKLFRVIHAPGAASDYPKYED